MDRKTANANLFITFHLLLLFLFSLFAAKGTGMLGQPIGAYLYYSFLVLSPVFLFIWLAERQSPWTQLGLNHAPLKGMGVGVIIGIMICAAFIGSDLIVGKTPLVTSAPWYMVLGAIFVGLAEEVLFRGFVLPRMMTQMTFVKANIFSSLLFMALHIARLFQAGAAEIPSLILIFIISLWLGYLYKKTRSVWTVMLVHALYNLAVLIF